MRATVLYVHGAFVFDSKWWWHRVAELLEEHDIASASIDLPSCGDTQPLGDLYADSKATREAIQSLDGPVIAVGHSYGGVVITDACAGLGDKVKHLLYIAAAVPDGTSVRDCGFVPEGEEPEFDLRDDGTAGEGSDGLKTQVLQALPDVSLTQGALTRLTRQSQMVFLQPIEGRAWKEIPSTYMLCLNDADAPVPGQRAQSQRCGALVEVATNHFPHLEQPELVANVLTDVVDKLTADSAEMAG